MSNAQHVEDVRTGESRKLWEHPISPDFTGAPRSYRRFWAESGLLQNATTAPPTLTIELRNTGGTVVSSLYSNSFLLRNSVHGGVFLGRFESDGNPPIGPLSDWAMSFGTGLLGATGTSGNRSWTVTTTEKWGELSNTTVTRYYQWVEHRQPSPARERWKHVWIDQYNAVRLSRAECVDAAMVLKCATVQTLARQWIVGGDGQRRALYPNMPGYASRVAYDASIDSVPWQYSASAPAAITPSAPNGELVVMQRANHRHEVAFAFAPAYQLHSVPRWIGYSYAYQASNVSVAAWQFQSHNQPGDQIDFRRSNVESQGMDVKDDTTVSEQAVSPWITLSWGVAANPLVPVPSRSSSEFYDDVLRETVQTAAEAITAAALSSSQSWQWTGTTLNGSQVQSLGRLENILGPSGLAGGSLQWTPPMANPLASEWWLNPTAFDATLVEAAGFNNRPGAFARTLTSMNGETVNVDLRVDASDSDDATKNSLRWIVDQEPSYPEGALTGESWFRISTVNGARGQLSWKPPPGWYGTRQATYRIFDGYDFSNEITLTLVSQPPF